MWAFEMQDGGAPRFNFLPIFGEARVELIEELVLEHEAYSRLVVGPMTPKCFEFRRDVKRPDFAKVGVCITGHQEIVGLGQLCCSTHFSVLLAPVGCEESLSVPSRAIKVSSEWEVCNGETARVT